MTNELILILFILFNLGAVLGCYKMGRRYLELYIIVALICGYCIAGKMFSAFGFPVSIAIATYSGIFLATDMLTEKYGKAVGYRMIRIGFLGALIFTAVTQIALFITPLAPMQELADAMDIVFGMSLRVFIGGTIAYVIAQHFDVWFYHFLHQKTGDKYLWIRNNGSTAISQLIDTVIFVSIAFYGIMPNIMSVLIVGYISKLCIAFLDTPFMYLSKRITPLDHRSSDKI